MDDFMTKLQNDLKPKFTIETVTLERIVNFYQYTKDNNWASSICWHEGQFSAWINTYGNGVKDGLGQTIDEALNDLLEQMG